MKTERVLKKKPIKAYKAFNSDLTCKDFQYEVGKEYHHKGKLELCESGFHACPKLVDCFRFYPFREAKTRVAEVLVWGKVEYEDVGVKLCASNIKIVRELAWSEVLILYNSNSGGCNSGDWNSGDWNSGSWNSGNYNTGNYNTGNYNTGNYNTGDWNAGIFNTGACEYTFAFNQLVKKQDLECLPSIPFLRFKLVEWIPEKHMLPETNTLHPKSATY